MLRRLLTRLAVPEFKAWLLKGAFPVLLLTDAVSDGHRTTPDAVRNVQEMIGQAGSRLAHG
jgi:hypothetical protein